MTDFSKVYVLPMDTVLTQKKVHQIKQIGFSRIPLCQDKDDKTVVAIFLTKSLVGYDECGETIRQAYEKGKISIRKPIFFTLDAKLDQICVRFKKGETHMGVVVESNDDIKVMNKHV